MSFPKEVIVNSLNAYDVVFKKPLKEHHDDTDGPIVSAAPMGSVEAYFDNMLEFNIACAFFTVFANMEQDIFCRYIYWKLEPYGA